MQRLLLSIAFACAGLVQAAAPAKPAYQSASYAPGPRPVSAKQLEELGRQLFFDRSLSASGRMSCATCHSPSHAYGPPNGLAAQLGGKDGKQPGTRAAPSLRYLQSVPPFSEHFHDNDGNDSEDAGPTGGYTWDGRADSAHAQASLPLLAANEMANGTPAAVVKSVRAAQSGAGRQPRPPLLRPGPVRPGAHRLQEPRRLLRPVPHAFAAQRGPPQNLLPQRRLP
ncbi:cytochrome-c peroxidase [Chromobacterium piscinae]|uniref:cytochrome-c peroxidase n=1 Tax=Chromobacterium piscinae TaxID=686831 RepID=UPI0032615666